MREIIAILKKAFFFFNYYDSVTFYNDVFKSISCRNFICYKVYTPFFLLLYDISYIFWKLSKKRRKKYC